MRSTNRCCESSATPHVNPRWCFCRPVCASPTAPVPCGAFRFIAITPLGRETRAAPLRMTLNGVTEFDVRVLEASRAGERAQWRPDWPVLRARPQLVGMRITSGSFAPTPFIVSLAPFEERQ